MKNASRKWKERLNFKNEFLFDIYEKDWVVLFSFLFTLYIRGIPVFRNFGNS